MAGFWRQGKSLEPWTLKWLTFSSHKTFLFILKQIIISIQIQFIKMGSLLDTNIYVVIYQIENYIF